MADLVSVVIPVYNTNERFKACFESVLKQKYQNIEVILVDDGSCNTSAQICDMVALSTLSFPVYVIHKPNGGVSRARNLGIDFANGKYLVFVDSDDQVIPNYISDFISARQKYPDVGHIWCGFEHCTNENTKYVYSDKESISFLTRYDYLPLYEKVMTQGPCQRLYDTNILRKNKIKMKDNLSLAEDIIFNLDYMDIVPSNNICMLNSANYLYIDKNGNSLKNQYRDDLAEIYEYYLLIMKQYLIKWGCFDEKSSVKYSDIVFYDLSYVMDSIIKETTISFPQTIKKCNRIMRSDMFIEAMSKNDIKMSPVLRKAYKSKNYLCVLIFRKISALLGRNK